MNSPERILTTLRHAEPDRVPVGEWGIDHDIAGAVLGRPTLYRAKAPTTRALWEGRRDEVVACYKEDTVELVRRLDHDLVPVFLVPPAGLPPERLEDLGGDTFRDSHGQTWRYSAGNDSLLLMSRPILNFETPADLRAYFEVELAGRFGFVIEAVEEGNYTFRLDDPSRLELVEHVVRELKGERFIFARGFEEDVCNVEPLYFSEFEFLNAFIGGSAEDYYFALVQRPDLVAEAARLYSQVRLAMAEVFIDAGVDAVMPGGDFSTSIGPLISPAMIRKHFLPGIKQLSDYVHGWGLPVMSHNCGNNWMILDMLLEAGFDCWQSIQSRSADMDFERLKEKYGADLALWGGINLETLVAGTPEETREDVLHALKTAAPGGGFILGTSNSVAFGSSYDAYMTALDTLKQYGGYPIEI